MRNAKQGTTTWLSLLLVICAAGIVNAQSESEEATEAGASDEASEISDEERATIALDSTATQWSFQFAWQVMPDHHDDVLANGQRRKPGNTDFAQLRIVAPIPLKGFTLLPRVTIRHYENAAGQSGIGNTEIFAPMISKSWDWGSGRFGIGPLVTLPGDEEVARDEWGYGLAMAVVNARGNWYYGILLTPRCGGLSIQTSSALRDLSTTPIRSASFPSSTTSWPRVGTSPMATWWRSTTGNPADSTSPLRFGWARSLSGPSTPGNSTVSTGRA